jgi:hypothetical protein
MRAMEHPERAGPTLPTPTKTNRDSSFVKTQEWRDCRCDYPGLRRALPPPAKLLLLTTKSLPERSCQMVCKSRLAAFCSWMMNQHLFSLVAYPPLILALQAVPFLHANARSIPHVPSNLTSYQETITGSNGCSPTSMRPADSNCRGAVPQCWVTAWMSRSARCSGLRR